MNIENSSGSFIDSILIDDDNLEKYNAKQGQIGDCWLFQVIISIYARYPEQIISKFIKPNLLSQTGIVAVKLWGSWSNSWRVCIMDDYLPCFHDSNLTWYGASPSGPFRNRFWVPFLEKAVAKQSGSFHNLNADKTSIGIEKAYRMILGPMMKEHH